MMTMMTKIQSTSTMKILQLKYQRRITLFVIFLIKICLGMVILTFPYPARSS